MKLGLATRQREAGGVFREDGDSSPTMLAVKCMKGDAQRHHFFSGAPSHFASTLSVS